MRTGYSRSAILFHWLIAGLMGGACLIGLSANAVPVELAENVLMPAHRLMGLGVFVLTIPRLASLVGRMRDGGWSGAAGNRPGGLGRMALYVAMVFLPVTGMIMVWIGWGFSGGMTDAFAASFGAALHQAAMTAHHVLGLAFVALLAWHVGSVLWHAFVSREDVLGGMSAARLIPDR